MSEYVDLQRRYRPLQLTLDVKQERDPGTTTSAQSEHERSPGRTAKPRSEQEWLKAKYEGSKEAELKLAVFLSAELEKDALTIPPQVGQFFSKTLPGLGQQAGGWLQKGYQQAGQYLKPMAARVGSLFSRATPAATPAAASAPAAAPKAAPGTFENPMVANVVSVRRGKSKKAMGGNPLDQPLTRRNALEAMQVQGMSDPSQIHAAAAKAGLPASSLFGRLMDSPLAQTGIRMGVEQAIPALLPEWAQMPAQLAWGIGGNSLMQGLSAAPQQQQALMRQAYSGQNLGLEVGEQPKQAEYATIPEIVAILPTRR